MVWFSSSYNNRTPRLSPFAALLTVMYIVEGDRIEPGRAFFQSQSAQDIAFLERLDPNPNRGKESRKEFKNDVARPDAFDIDRLEDVQKHLANLQSILNDP